MCPAEELHKCSRTHPNNESQSWKSSRQFAGITNKFNSQRPNDHCTVSAPLYIPPPSQLTSSKPRTRSGTPVCQLPASPALANQKALILQTSIAHTPLGEDGHKRRAYQKQKAPTQDVPTPSRAPQLTAHQSQQNESSPPPPPPPPSQEGFPTSHDIKANSCT